MCGRAQREPAWGFTGVAPRRKQLSTFGAGDRWFLFGNGMNKYAVKVNSLRLPFSLFSCGYWKMLNFVGDAFCRTVLVSTVQELLKSNLASADLRSTLSWGAINKVLSRDKSRLEDSEPSPPPPADQPPPRKRSSDSWERFWVNV